MANRQARDPGSFREVTGTARLSGIPSIAVETGQAARALAQVAGQLSSRLGQMADEAAVREATVAALADVQQDPGAASYQQARAVETAAASRAQVNAAPDVRNAISAAAQKHGVDPAALMRIAELESSLNPKAKNPNSSAGGLFQFIDGTAQAYGLADRFDPVQASDAAARLARDNAASLRKVLGREPTVGELYLAHQQGAGGAAKLLGNRDADAASLVGADAVRLNGGRDGMTAGEFADLWVAKAEGRTGRAGPGAPAAPPRLPPLALRRDGTIYGEAYDRAAMSAYSWRLDTDVSTRLTAIFDEHQNNPAAFAGEVQKLQQEYLTSEDLRDPQLREAFARNFAERSQGYALKVAALQQQRVQAEQRVAVEDGLSARALELEKKAYGLGAAPEGDQLLADELAQLNRSIDGAVASGALTAAEGAKQKERLAGTATRARVQGVFDAIEGSAAQEQFALGLLEDWKDGKGPVAKMPFAEVKALARTLYSEARSRTETQSAAARVERQRLKRLLDDDVASIEATGKPLDLAEAGTDLETIQASMTPVEYDDWLQRRDVAGQMFQASAGMEALPAPDILRRLDGIAPEPGTPGYAQDLAVYRAVEKKAEAVLKARAADPLGAAHQAGLVDLAPLDPSSGEAMEQSLQTRREQARLIADAWGEPVPLFRPDELKNAKAMLKTTDPMTYSMVMMQADFLAGETSMDNLRLSMGEDAVDGLLDWRGRLRHLQPDEVAVWLRDKADPKWQERVKPLFTKGLKEARQIDLPQIVSGLDTNFWFDAVAPVDTETQRMMLADFETLFAERYVATSDTGTAREQALEKMKRTWGVTSVYGDAGGRGGRVMPYPPEQHYPVIANSHEWIREELAGVVKGLGADPANVSLVSDGKTKAAADRGERPGYLIAVVDPETGLSDLARDDQGRVIRHFFDEEAAKAAALQRAEEERRTRNDPWLVLGEGTAIGPFYDPVFNPATEADLAHRRARIPEILSERTSRMRAWQDDKRQKLKQVQELMNDAERP